MLYQPRLLTRRFIGLLLRVCSVYFRFRRRRVRRVRYSLLLGFRCLQLGRWQFFHSRKNYAGLVERMVRVVVIVRC